MFTFLKRVFCCADPEKLYNPISKKKYRSGSILPIDRSDKRHKQNRMKYYT